MQAPRSPATLFALATLLSVASAGAEGTPPEQETRNEIRAGADWRFYGQFSDQSGFAYHLELARAVKTWERSRLAVGGRVMWSPNQRIYGVVTENGASFAVSRETRLLHVGVPLTFRHAFSDGGVAPFFEFRNIVDIKVLERTESRPFATTCMGPSWDETCYGPEDYEESARNYPVIVRQGLALGLRKRLGGAALSLSQGVRWDLTPSRGETPHGGGSRREIVLSATSLGLEF